MSSGLGNGLKDRHRIQYLTEVSHQISIQKGLGSLNALVKLHVNSGCSHCSEIGKENIQDHLMLDVWPQWMVPFDSRQLQMPGVGNRQQSGKALFEVDVGHRMTDHVQASQCLKKVRKKMFFYYLYWKDLNRCIWNHVQCSRLYTLDECIPNVGHILATTSLTK